MAKPYLEDMDFAFFVVNFGYTKKDYLALTLREKAFIYKAYENKTISTSTMIRDAVLNAEGNLHRKKGSPFRKLWKKKQQKADKVTVQQNMNEIMQIEKNEKGWIDAIYEANGMKKPKRKKV